MSESLTCTVAADGERVHRYVAGTLEAAEVAEFETHLLGCVECQGAVREAAVVGAALRGMATGGAGAAGATRRRTLWWVIPLAAAAGALWLVLGREGALAKLGRVSAAPVFAGVPVRGDADSASRLADSGMAMYAAGRYRDAARLLGGVPIEVRTPGVRFYLGVAWLLGTTPQEAAQRLAEVPAESPYAAEAHFYRAKAWLRLGRADSALAELAAVPSNAAIAAHAGALADSVREVLR